METLSDDEWVVICTFLPIKYLSKLSQTSQFFHNFIMNVKAETCNAIWREHCQIQSREYGSSEQVSVEVFNDDIHSFLDLYKSQIFRLETCPNDTEADYSVISNHGHTVFNSRDNGDIWQFVRVNKPVKMGQICRYEVVVDHIDNHTGNSWNIAVGFQEEDYTITDYKSYAEAKRFYDLWLTKFTSGVGLILWSGQIVVNNSERKPLDIYTTDIKDVHSNFVKAGDVVGVELDWTETQCTFSACINGVALFKWPYSAIPLNHNQVYPSMSLVNGQKFSVYGGWSRTHKLMKQNKTTAK